MSASNTIGLVILGDSTQSAETAEAGCPWLEGGLCGPLSGFEIRGGCKRVNVSEIHIDTTLPVVLMCVHVCVCVFVLLYSEFHNTHSTSKVRKFCVKLAHFTGPHTFNGLFEG